TLNPHESSSAAAVPGGVGPSPLPDSQETTRDSSEDTQIVSTSDSQSNHTSGAADEEEHPTTKRMAMRTRDTKSHGDKGSSAKGEYFSRFSTQHQPSGGSAPAPDPQTPVRGKRKPNWRGWVEVQEGEALPTNNQDQFEAIRRAAAEAAEAESGAAGRKSLREKRSSGPSDLRGGNQLPKTRKTKDKHQSGRKQKPEISNEGLRQAKRNEKEGKSRGREVEMGKQKEKELRTAVIAKESTPDGSRTNATSPVPQQQRAGQTQDLAPHDSLGGDASVLGEKAEELEELFTMYPDCLGIIQSNILSRLVLEEAPNKGPEYDKIHKLLSQTVLAGEGNSMLITGPRGTGKTRLVEMAVSDLQRNNKDDFHVVRLNAFIHTDDKIALREIWRQLGRDMNVDDELASGRTNYADILTSLLALLSHEEAPSAEEPSPRNRSIAKSVVFVLDEFHLFASHPRQTLLYNLFDLAQSSTTPLAVIGLTTRTDAVDMLEKRVKSRFGQRMVQLTPPRTLTAFKVICREALMYRSRSPTKSASRFAHPSPSLGPIVEAWNTYIPLLLSYPELDHHIESIYSTTRQPSSFFISALLPILSLNPQSPVPTASSFSLKSLQPPDSHLASVLPSLSTLALSLLIAAARLEIILAPNPTTNTAISNMARTAASGPSGVNFETVYAEYMSLATRSRASASVAGHVGVGGAEYGARRLRKGSGNDLWS
ncbi:uncharacterized protein KY384_003341, partial [Bacidia gigantensis]|uniref:uncharacterized protein n=1 Tax=Bacidia gigantensis TaxID=2732470 RepID=UPI001D04F95F